MDTRLKLIWEGARQPSAMSFIRTSWDLYLHVWVSIISEIMIYLLILFRAGRTAGDSRTGECEVEQVRPQNLHHQPAGGPGGGGCSVQAESSTAGIHHRG